MQKQVSILVHFAQFEINAHHSSPSAPMRFFDIFGIDPRGCACMFVALTALARAWHADPAQAPSTLVYACAMLALGVAGAVVDCWREVKTA